MPMSSEIERLETRRLELECERLEQLIEQERQLHNLNVEIALMRKQKLEVGHVK